MHNAIEETDRELLEKAAKAAGIENVIVYESDDGTYWYAKTGKHTHWSPLTDDGDALRLAVKLDIAIDDACVTYSDGAPDDPYAATRRAIVRAAAARA